MATYLRTPPATTQYYSRSLFNHILITTFDKVTPTLSLQPTQPTLSHFLRCLDSLHCTHHLHAHNVHDLHTICHVFIALYQLWNKVILLLSTDVLCILHINLTFYTMFTFKILVCIGHESFWQFCCEPYSCHLGQNMFNQ